MIYSRLLHVWNGSFAKPRFAARVADMRKCFHLPYEELDIFQASYELRPLPHVSGYFWIHNFFFPDSKISPSTRSLFKSNSPVHTHPMVSGFTPEKLALHVMPPHWFNLLFGKRLDTILLRHRIRKYPDSPSTSYRIRCGFIFFHSGERIKKYPDSLPNSPDACGREPCPERKGCGFKNIRIGKKDMPS